MLDFSKIFEFVTFPLVVAEPVYPNNLLYVNKAFCDLTGYSPEELIGVNPGQLLQRPPYTKTREMIRERLNTFQSIDVLVKNYRKNGEWYWNELHIHPVIENDACIYWVGTSKDVTKYVEEMSTHLDSIVALVRESFRKMKTGLDLF